MSTLYFIGIFMYTAPGVSHFSNSYATMQTSSSSLIFPAFQIRAQQASHIAKLFYIHQILRLMRISCEAADRRHRLKFPFTIAVLLKQPALAANLATDNLPYEPNLLLRALHHLFLSKQMLKRNPLPAQDAQNASAKIHVGNRNPFLQQSIDQRHRYMRLLRDHDA